MKNTYFTLLFAAVSFCGYSQEEAPGENQKAVALQQENNEIYNTAAIEFKPDYPGGLQEFYNYIGRNYRVPKVAGLQGKVFVTFVVEKDGSLSDIKVLRDIGHGTGKEAIRVLKKCEKWTPGEQNGKKVRVLYALPINIQTK